MIEPLFLIAGNNSRMARSLDRDYIWVPRQSSIAAARRLVYSLSVGADWICFLDDDDEFIGLDLSGVSDDCEVIFARGGRCWDGIPVPWWMKIFKRRILEGYSFPNNNLKDNQLEDFLAINLFRNRKSAWVDPWVKYSGSHFNFNKTHMTYDCADS